MNNTMPPPASSVPIDLITNGHFDIWQRGNNVSGNTMQIGPDMWSGNGNLSRIYSKAPDGCAIAATQSGVFMGISQRIEWDKALNDMVVSAGCLTLIYEYTANQPCIDYQGNRCTQAYAWHTTLEVVPFTSTDGETALANGYYNLADRIGINCLLNGDPLPVGFSFTVKYVRCLIGAYTLDSVPPYVPPDPSAELLQCQRYYENSWYPQTKSAGNEMFAIPWRDIEADGRIELKAPKRIVPTITFFPENGKNTWEIYRDTYRAIRNVSVVARGGVNAIVFRLAKESDTDASIWEVGKTFQVRGHWEACADL